MDIFVLFCFTLIYKTRQLVFSQHVIPSNENSTACQLDCYIVL